MSHEKDVAATLIALERAALDRWGQGDPSGYLELSAPEVVYFDPFLEHRLDGLDALTRYYEALRGQVHIDRDEFINPNVQVCGEAAVLTFNYVSHTGATQMRWNCTEVYRRQGGRWRIIQTHWSITQHFVCAALQEKLQRVDEAVLRGEITIEEGAIRLLRLKAEEGHAETNRLRAALFKEIGTVQLPDLILQVDALAGFSHAMLDRPARSEQELLRVYGGMLAHGTSFDASAIALQMPQLTAAQILVGHATF